MLFHNINILLYFGSNKFSLIYILYTDYTLYYTVQIWLKPMAVKKYYHN